MQNKLIRIKKVKVRKAHEATSSYMYKYYSLFIIYLYITNKVRILKTEN